MYSIIALISFIIRQYCLPNPFEVLVDGVIWRIGEVDVLLSPVLLNFIVSAVLPHFTYTIVRIYYEKGSNPALGSFIYLLLYCIHISLVYIMSLFGFDKYCVYALIGIYVGGHILAMRIREKRGYCF